MQKGRLVIFLLLMVLSSRWDVYSGEGLQRESSIRWESVVWGCGHPLSSCVGILRAHSGDCKR